MFVTLEQLDLRKTQSDRKEVESLVNLFDCGEGFRLFRKNFFPTAMKSYKLFQKNFGRNPRALNYLTKLIKFVFFCWGLFDFV